MRCGAALGILLAVEMTAQTGDIHQRLLQTLGPEADVRAEVLLRDKRYTDVEAMLAEKPSSETLALRGALEFLNGRMTGAAGFFRQAANAGTLTEQDRFTLAMALAQMGHDDEARRELTPLAAQQPQKAMYVYWLGRLDYDQRRYTEAVENLKKATELDPKSARAWDSLGLAYDMQSNVDEALKAFEEGVRVNREQARHSGWPPHDLGTLLLRIGETNRAKAALREALQYDSQMEPAHYHLGRALEKDGANEEAVKEYLIAMGQEAKATDVCYSLAMLYRKMGRKKDADSTFAEWRRRRDAQ